MSERLVEEELMRLGQSGVMLPRLGLGAWAWGDRIMWGYGREYGPTEVRGAFEASLAAGIAFIDTAEMYGGGNSERLLGTFMQEASRVAFRNERRPIVATKFMPLPWRWRKNSLIQALRRSLGRLRLKQVDLYQIHWPFPPRAIETWVEALADTVDAGLARAVGVSNFSVDQMRRAHDVLSRRGIPLASNQVEYSLLQRAPERSGLLAACRGLGVTLIAYSPIAKGLLSGKYTPRNPPPGIRGWRYNAGRLKALQPLIEVLREVGQARGKTPAQVALNWTMCKGALPIPGAKNAQQAEENAGALGWRLSDEEVARLDEVSRGVRL